MDLWPDRCRRQATNEPLAARPRSTRSSRDRSKSRRPHRETAALGPTTNLATTTPVLRHQRRSAGCLAYPPTPEADEPRDEQGNSAAVPGAERAGAAVRGAGVRRTPAPRPPAQRDRIQRTECDGGTGSSSCRCAIYRKAPIGSWWGQARPAARSTWRSAACVGVRKCSAAARYVLQDVHICTFGPSGPIKTQLAAAASTRSPE